MTMPDGPRDEVECCDAIPGRGAALLLLLSAPVALTARRTARAASKQEAEPTLAD
jgi:hypothetical protein